MIRDIYNKLNDSVDVYLQDQTTNIVSLYLIDKTNEITSNLTVGASIGDTTISVDDATGIVTDGTQAINMCIKI